MKSVNINFMLDNIKIGDIVKGKTDTRSFTVTALGHENLLCVNRSKRNERCMKYSTVFIWNNQVVVKD